MVWVVIVLILAGTIGYTVHRFAPVVWVSLFVVKGIADLASDGPTDYWLGCSPLPDTDRPSACVTEAWGRGGPNHEKIMILVWLRKDTAPEAVATYNAPTMQRATIRFGEAPNGAVRELACRPEKRVAQGDVEQSCTVPVERLLEDESISEFTITFDAGNRIQTTRFAVYELRSDVRNAKARWPYLRTK